MASPQETPIMGMCEKYSHRLRKRAKQHAVIREKQKSEGRVDESENMLVDK